jgi:hypothetical protein
MLKRKQYLLTLFIGIVLFFIVFLTTYYYIVSHSKTSEVSESRAVGKGEQSIDVIAAVVPERELTVQPDTDIRLVVVDEDNRIVEDKKIDPLILNGLNQVDLEKRFEGYQLMTFDEKQITLKKTIAHQDKPAEYALGIEDDFVCIVEKGDIKTYIKLDLLANYFSRNTYSLLLKEQIPISPVQKEELLKNPYYIDKILQSYEEE